MKKWRVSIVSLLCALCLLPAGKAMASETEVNVAEQLESLMPQEDSFMFEDGDVVGFIGDSITQVNYTGISYQEFIYNYYITRHPDWDLEFRNLGTSSFTAADAVKLYSGQSGITDPAIEGINKAVIMFGMNEGLNNISADSYIQSIRQLVSLLNERGIENEHIILTAPTPYDQTRSSNYTEDGQMIEQTDDLISQYVPALKELAEELGTQYVDLHTPMLWINGIVQSRIADDTLTVTDNVHPNAMGNVFAGFFFLYQQGAGNQVASVRIGTGQEAEAENAEITRIQRRDTEYLSFFYQPGSLPIAVSYELEQAGQYFPVIDQISWENLAIDELEPEKNYRLFLDGVLAGEFTGEELGEGINLTNLDGNPGKETAETIESLNQQWHTASSDYREIVRSAYEGKAEQEDVDTAYEQWETVTAKLRGQIYEAARTYSDKGYRVEVAAEDFPLWRGRGTWRFAVLAAVILAAAGGGLLVRKRKRRRTEER